ncbi:MAG: DUF3768 domain-containing protein [Litorimonas sp.]
MTNKTQKIRRLNDRMRKGDASVPGQIVLTRGIADLLEESKTAPDDLIQMVRSYDNFTTDNDPHGEHDFGSFELAGYPCFWKLDYYDPTLKWGSNDPSDPKQTMRVLTIMLTEEY